MGFEIYVILVVLKENDIYNKQFSPPLSIMEDIRY